MPAFSEFFFLLTSGSSFSVGTKTIARLILLCVAPPLSLLLSVNLCLFYSVFLLCFFFSSGSSSGFWVLFFSSPSLCFFFVLLLCFFPPLLLRLSLIFRPKESPPFSSDFRPLLQRPSCLPLTSPAFTGLLSSPTRSWARDVVHDRICCRLSAPLLNRELPC